MSTYHYFSGSDTDVVIIPSAGMSIRLDHEKPMGSGKSPLATAAGGADVGLEPGAQPSAVKTQVFGLGAVGDLMPWGAGNDFPQRITALYSKDPIIPTTLGKIAAMVQGQGIIPVLEDVDEDGDVIRRPLPKNDPVAAKIRAFLTSRHFKQYMREMSSDATMYFNGWPELIISKNREEIVQLHPLNAEECRWCMMDDNGNLTHIFLDANWGNHIAQQSTSKKITALDPYNTDLVDWLRQRSEYNVVYPIRFPTPGQRYYSLPHHYSLVESGWLDVHLAVPQFKKFLLKNQMSIKYHVKVNTDYWPICFGAEWDNAKAQPDKQKGMIKKWLDGVTAMLTNVENAGATLVTQVQAGLSDPSKVVDYVTVTVIQDPIKDGKYIQDNLEAAANIFYALNVDPTLVGFAGGEKMGARSGGSDKLQAYLIALQMLLPFREMLIEPLDFVADYNGWKAHFPLLKFVFPDQNPSAKKGDQKKEESKPAPDRKADKPTA